MHAEDVAVLHRMNQVEVPAIGALDARAFSDLLDLADEAVLVRADGHTAAFMVLMREASDYDSRNYRWFAERLDGFAYVDRGLRFTVMGHLQSEDQHKEVVMLPRCWPRRTKRCSPCW
ncbi:MAG: hypothetical protein ACR2HR_12470 [Euzebya sp.]